jgi:hypothetical protein
MGGQGNPPPPHPNLLVHYAFIFYNSANIKHTIILNKIYSQCDNKGCITLHFSLRPCKIVLNQVSFPLHQISVPPPL